MDKLDFSKKELLKMKIEESSKHLEGRGYVRYPEFGWIKESRLQECISRGLIKSLEGEFLLTREGAKYNTLVYIMGNSDVLQKYDSLRWGEEKKEEIKKEQVFNETNELINL